MIRDGPEPAESALGGVAGMGWVGVVACGCTTGRRSRGSRAPACSAEPESLTGFFSSFGSDTYYPSLMRIYAVDGQPNRRGGTKSDKNPRAATVNAERVGTAPGPWARPPARSAQLTP